MNKLLAVNHELIVRSYIAFPTLLCAFAVSVHGRVITFAWPFIFVYTIERVMPFVLDGRFNLSSWSETTKFFATTACGGQYWRVEWVLSIAALLIGFGVSGLKLMADPNQELSGIDLKKINRAADWLVVLSLGILGLLLAKVSLFSAFVFYTLLLGLEVWYAFRVVQADRRPLDLHLSFNLKTGVPALTVLTIVLIISIFKKTGRISDLSWTLIILAVIGLVIETQDALRQPFKSFRIWLGAVKNYLIVYTLLFAFQLNHVYWILIVFAELMLGGIVAGVLAKKTAAIPLPRRYAVTLLVLLGGLVLTYTDWTYLWGTGISAVATLLLNNWAAEQDLQGTVSAKLSVFGSLCNQIVLFGMLEVISRFEFNNKIALLLPYLDHQQAVQDSRGMLCLRAVMILFFILTGIIAILLDRRWLFTLQDQ